MNLSVSLGRLTLENPILVASGTFGYAREMLGVFDLARLGGIVPKTVTLDPREGNKPPRTVETTSGLLNAIGLDNDGIDQFLKVKLPCLREMGPPVIISIAAKKPEECALFGEKLKAAEGIAAIELNVSCPNVSDGTDYGTNADRCKRMVAEMRKATDHILFVKLTPNVANIAEIAVAAAVGGADGISAVNTCVGMSIDWRNRKPRLANITGGLSGPAIKPIALRCVYQIDKEFKKQQINIPIIGIGGIATVDDVLEFMVAGASAVQIGTANFYNPTVVPQILDELPKVLAAAEIDDIREIIGTLKIT